MDFYQSLYTSDPSYSPLSIGISLAISIVAIISYWKIFKKAGQPGWKAIIPFYNSYIIFKIAWKVKWFFISLIASIVFIVTATMASIYLFRDLVTNVPLISVSLFIMLILLIIAVMSSLKLSRVFGHGVGYGIGLILLNPIFLLILAFGNSEYVPEVEETHSDDSLQVVERRKPNSFKDFFYDKNDIIVVLIIVAVAGLIIYTRIGAIMDYPEILAKKAAAAETTQPIKETSDQQSDSSASATVSITITDSDTSVTVATKIYEAGLVTSDVEFQNYISTVGKENSLKSGTFQIPSGSSNEEILNIIAN